MVTLEEMNQLKKSANGKCNYNLVLLTNKKAGAIFLEKNNVENSFIFTYTYTFSLHLQKFTHWPHHHNTQFYILNMSTLSSF